MKCDVSEENSLIKIYKELKNLINFQNPCLALSQLCDYFINTGDYEACERRIQAFEKILGSLSNQLKQKKAVVLYMLGNPQLWDELQQEEEAKKIKKREQNKAKKEQIIVNNIKKATAQQKNNQQPQPSRPTIISNKLTMAKQQIDEHPYITNTEEESPKIQAQKNEKEQDARQEKKQAAKNAKKGSALGTEVKEEKHSSPTINIESLPQEQPIFHIQPKVAKLYTELYSLQPKLTNKNVVKLLAGFDLIIGLKDGKGSHTKCTFDAGEVITNQNNKVIFSCPNLQSLMTIVPKWSSKNIPFYMIKNLRYILEKIGVTEENIVLQKDQ